MQNCNIYPQFTASKTGGLLSVVVSGMFFLCFLHYFLSRVWIRVARDRLSTNAQRKSCPSRTRGVPGAVLSESVKINQIFAPIVVSARTVFNLFSFADGF